METTELRRLQLLELELLKRVKQICDKYRLIYYLDSGTLLGAARHKGFIPWDDDIDITMPFKDYKAFLRIAQKELGNRFFVQNYQTEGGFNRGFTKIRIKIQHIYLLEMLKVIYIRASGWIFFL